MKNKENSLVIKIDYPIDAVLRTKKTLPKFKYNCPVRREILHIFLWNQCKNKKMKKQIQSLHRISDYIVESVVKKQGVEIAWIVGS